MENPANKRTYANATPTLRNHWGWIGSSKVLVAVFVGQVLGEVGFELAVVGVDGGAQRGFRGTALAERLQDALNIAHAVSVVDVGDGGQGLGIRKIGLTAREALEARFEHIQRNVSLRLEQLGELGSASAEAFGLKELRDTFVQPGRATRGGQLVKEGVRQFVLQNASQFRRERAQAADRNSQLAIVDGA